MRLQRWIGTGVGGRTLDLFTFACAYHQITFVVVGPLRQNKHVGVSAYDAKSG